LRSNMHLDRSAVRRPNASRSAGSSRLGSGAVAGGAGGAGAGAGIWPRGARASARVAPDIPDLRSMTTSNEARGSPETASFGRVARGDIRGGPRQKWSHVAPQKAVLQDRSRPAKHARHDSVAARHELVGPSPYWPAHKSRRVEVGEAGFSGDDDARPADDAEP